MTSHSGAAYRAALEFLFPRTTTIKLGLDTTRALLASLGDPHLLVPVIHIAGTNGKGSVAALAAAALRAAGWRTGLYTSPHLVSFRERIRVDGEPIAEAAVAMWTERLRPLMLQRDATFFEATTAMAFADFAARGAELVVAEVGLGGRLDSTNVVQPAVTAVTRIAREHEAWLGDTLEKIAREKAGIAKQDVPFVIGEGDPALASVLADVAQAAGARVLVVPPHARWAGQLGLAGEFQRRNAAVAEAVLAMLPEPWRPTPEAVARGFLDADLAGRLDRRGRWLFDVAHNPDGVAALVAELARSPLPPPATAVVGILADKDWRAMLELLAGAVERGIATVAASAGARAWDLEEVAAWLAENPRLHGWRIVTPFAAALDEAAAGPGGILVTGSFHTVGDAMGALGLGSAAPDGI